MNIKHILSIIILSTFLIQCQGEKNTTFLITNNAVGKITRTSLFSNIETIYATDSIIKDTFNVRFGSNAKRFKIYEKGGKHLLTISPSNDSIPKFENIRIYDPRFVTEKGVGINSSFKEISDQYEIKKIIILMNSVIVSLKETDVYFTLDKSELPANLRYTTSKVEAVQIPGTAKVKYMMVGWD